jgi:GTP-binding protein Era
MTDETQTQHCGVVALIGAPNAGKSTLINALVGSKIAIVTPKVQTTRQALRGVQIVDQTQIIYTDTPGIFNAPQAYEQAMVSHAWSAAGEADVVLVVVDASQTSYFFSGDTPPADGESDANATRRALHGDMAQALKDIFQKVARYTKPKILVLNKVDKMPKPKLLALIAWLNQHAVFDETFMISALKGEGVGELQQWLASKMPEGPWLFPEDQLSDMPLRFLAAEITREKLFMRLREELPYGLMVETEAWEEKKDGSVKINQVIIVQRDGHKKIVLGKNGEQLKAIGQSARRDIAQMMECPVHLFLFIKVIPDWKDRREYLPGQQLM